MLVAAAVLAAALSRAEIIERFRAVPITKVQGLVQVVADCPVDMRAEFQGPVAGFAADVCNKLYVALREHPVRFEEPGIIVVVGDVRTNATDVIVRRTVRDNGSRLTRIFLPAPAHADVDAFRTEVARAFFLAVKGREIGRAAAGRAIRDADPKLKADYGYSQVEKWLAGEKTDGDDEDMLKICRSVMEPGAARPWDVLHFASRLFLYPESYDSPFCGLYPSCTFQEAVDIAATDPRVRFFAMVKASQVAAFGAGRSEALVDAARAYSEALIELGRGKLPKDELHALFDAADVKLNVALEDAIKRQEAEGGGAWPGK